MSPALCSWGLVLVASRVFFLPLAQACSSLLSFKSLCLSWPLLGCSLKMPPLCAQGHWE